MNSCLAQRARSLVIEREQSAPPLTTLPKEWPSPGTAIESIVRRTPSTSLDSFLRSSVGLLICVSIEPLLSQPSPKIFINTPTGPAAQYGHRRRRQGRRRRLRRAARRRTGAPPSSRRRVAAVALWAAPGILGGRRPDRVLRRHAAAGVRSAPSSRRRRWRRRQVGRGSMNIRGPFNQLIVGDGRGSVPSDTPTSSQHPQPLGSYTHGHTHIQRAAPVEVAGPGGSGAASGMPALPSVSAAGSNE